MKKALLLFCLSLALCAGAQPVTFTKKADFPGSKRWDQLSFAIGNNVYAGAGYFDSLLNGAALKDRRDLYAYNTTANTWSKKADVPFSAVRDNNCVEINGVAYAGFGWDDVGLYRDWWQYNSATDTWTQKARFPDTARWGSSMFESGGKGYMVGGTVDGVSRSLKEVWQYDPSLDKWTRKADFPGTARCLGFAVASGGTAWYGLGGSGNNYFSDMYKYNVAADTWTPIASIPARPNLPVTDGNVYFSVIEGRKIVLTNMDVDDTAIANKYAICIYDTSANTWTCYPAANKAGFRYTNVCEKIGRKAYMGGGATFRLGWYTDMWEIDLAGLTTAVEATNPGLADIHIHAAGSKIQAVVPMDVFVRNGSLRLDIFSMDGRKLGSYPLEKSGELEASALLPGSYAYVLKSATTLLKSGMVVLQ